MSLFPFLAVLICTMGALVPLLLAIARQARLSALREATAKAAQQQTDVKEEHDVVQWRTAQLKTSREKTEEQLGEARLLLGHVEDHWRRLRRQAAELQGTIEDLEKLGTQSGRQRSELEAELVRVRTELARADAQLTDAQRNAARRQPSYAIVPYEGPNQTHRRPIYIECTADTVILQPEGIVLEASDFEGPLGPGNPLAAALRAVREYLLTHGGFDAKQTGEPYPLLLVRSSGIAAYYAARAAMKTWGTEFGYELVNDDWKLNFPKPDPNLADVVRQTVATARETQQRLIAAAPRSYGGRSRATYRVAPGRGGVIREDGPDEDDEPAFLPRRPAGSFGSRYGGDGAGNDRHGSGKAAGDGRYASAGNDAGSANLPPGDVASGEGPVFGSAGRASPGGGSPGGAGGTGSLPARVAGSPGGASGGAANQSSRKEGMLNFGPRGQPQGPPPPDGQQGTPLRPGEWYPSEPRPREKPEEEKDDDKHGKPHKRDKNLAATRGKDWGLRDAAGGSVPITRPIRVECHADRLVLLPDHGTAGAKEIRLGSRTEDSIDDFISAVWGQMELWGIAGKGMYWRPVLHVRADPEAEYRCRELAALLEGSGLTVERK